MRVILQVWMGESLQVHVVNFTALVRCNDNVIIYKSKMMSVQGGAGRGMRRVYLSGALKSLPILCFPSAQDVSNTAQMRRPLLLR